MSLAELGQHFLGRNRPSSRRGRGSARGKASRVAIEALESRLVMAVSTWSGAVDALWSKNGNWDTPPVAGNDLVFPAASSNLTNANDPAIVVNAPP